MPMQTGPDTITAPGGLVQPQIGSCRIESIRPLQVDALKESQKDLREAGVVERG